MFRVDDVVRPAGCSNKTGGTYPLLIYPNIVNMLGEMTVDVNGICLMREKTYVLMIEQRQTAACKVLNPAMARCTLPKIYDWGSKTVYFQPQDSGANEEKAFVGYIYFGKWNFIKNLFPLVFARVNGTCNWFLMFIFDVIIVPPTLDPMRLEIGNIYNWFENPIATDVSKIYVFPALLVLQNIFKLKWFN